MGVSGAVAADEPRTLLRPIVPRSTGEPVHWGPMDSSAASRPAFAHASEAEFARILDFYEVRWEYEPHTFPILWNLDGAVVESFAPDFFLPDLGLYVEMTTLRQSLVRRKNRKLRRLRELYPDIRIKLFYGRDFRALMLKYGKLALIDEMSGTLGQSTPAKSGDAEASGEAVIARPAAESAVGPSPESAAIAPRAAATRTQRARREAATVRRPTTAEIPAATLLSDGEAIDG
jgi:hypothetical protein